MHTFKRVLNITRDQQYDPPEASALSKPAERTLHLAITSVEQKVADAAHGLRYDEALGHILSLREPVAAFFDAVLVDAPDPAVKAVRMGLLIRAARVFLVVADFSRISTR
jgi:glycyl-tRNA synthetase beta chain